MGGLERGCVIRSLAFLGVLAAAGMVAGPVRAQMDSREAIQLQNQVLELRRDVQALREQFSRMGSSGGSSLGGYRGAPAPVPAPAGDLTAALLERVNQLEEQVRRMQGRLDEVDNARQRQGEELKKELEDLNFKLGQSPGAGAAPPARPATEAPAAPPAARRTPELAMQEGNAALARRDYAAAEKAAREVLAFPRSPRAVDAQFLLAQALAGKRDYQTAAVAFDDTYNRSKTGTHAQPALLGLANALIAINEKRSACAALEKLKDEFPKPRADLREPIASARQRAGCR